MKRLLLLISLLCPLLATAKEKAPSRICRVLFLNPPADAPKTLFLFDGSESREIELSAMSLSDPLPVPAGDVVLQLTPEPVVKPAQAPPGAPSGKLPASFGDIYLVVTPDPANTVAPVKLRIMDTGPGKFTKGQMICYNLTSSTISGQLGSRKLDLAGQSQVVVDEPVKENGPFDVDLSYLIPGDPTLHPLSQTKWIHDPRSRMVMFVHAEAEDGVPQITGAKDFRD